MSTEFTTPINVRDTLLSHLAQFPNAYKCWEMTRDSPQHPVEALHAGAEYKMFDTEDLSGVSMSLAQVSDESIPVSVYAENHCGMRLYRLGGDTTVPVHGREMSFEDACADPNITTTNCISTVGHSHLIGFWDTGATNQTVPHTKYLARAIRKDGSLAPTAHAWTTDEATGGPHTPSPNGPRFPIGAFADELSIREYIDLPFERAMYGGKVETDVDAFVKCLRADLTHVFVRHASPPVYGVVSTPAYSVPSPPPTSPSTGANTVVMI